VLTLGTMCLGSSKQTNRGSSLMMTTSFLGKKMRLWSCQEAGTGTWHTYCCIERRESHRTLCVTLLNCLHAWQCWSNTLSSCRFAVPFIVSPCVAADFVRFHAVLGHAYAWGKFSSMYLPHCWLQLLVSLTPAEIQILLQSVLPSTPSMDLYSCKRW